MFSLDYRMPKTEGVERLLARVEKIINPFDWIPFVGSVSGYIRIVAGYVQAAATPLFVLLKIYTNILTTGRPHFKESLKEGFWICYVHGTGNVLRGIVAIHPFANMSLFFYDKYVGRVNYESETDKDFYPIMTAYKGPRQFFPIAL